MKVALITGAASGLGWALARHWHAKGWRLVLADIDADLLDQRRRELDGHGQVLCVITDIARADDIRALVEQLTQSCGRLDLLINNAGITHRSPASQTDPAVLRKVMAVDWQGPVELTLACLPLLRASQGQIVCIGSMAGWMPVPGRAAYCAAKAALTQFFEVLRLELEADGIHILMAYPSFLDTPIEHHALGRDGTPARHARSTVGRLRSAEWMVALIDRGLERRTPWLLPEPLSRFGSLLWRLAPSLYLWTVRRRFASDLT